MANPSHPSYNLKSGDIAIGRFGAVSGHGREKGVMLSPHPVLVLEVNHAKKEATVMLLGSEKEGNTASQLGFTPQEQKLAKLDKPSVYKPTSLSVMPLERLNPTGGHLPDATMNRVEHSLERNLRQGTVVVTHQALDGELSRYDIARGKKTEVLLQSPQKATQAARAYEASGSGVGKGLSEAHPPAKAFTSGSSAVKSVTEHHPLPKSFGAGAAALELSAVSHGSELASIGKELLHVAERNVGKLAGGPVGDAYAMMDITMAATTVLDNHTNHMLTEGPIGKAVAYAGEHSGAFRAIQVSQEAAAPYIEKAHAIADPYIDKAAHVAAVISEKTGLMAVENKLESLASSAVTWSAAHVENVQKLYHDTVNSAGLAVRPLDHEEARHLTAELAKVQPGDTLAIDRAGSIELHKNGVALAQADKNSVLVDAHAFKEQAGLTRSGHDNNRAPDNARER